MVETKVKCVVRDLDNTLWNDALLPNRTRLR